MATSAPQPLCASASSQPSGAAGKQPYVDKMRESVVGGLKDVPPVTDADKDTAAPIKKKGGRDPITNKSPWTKEVSGFVFWRQY